MKAKLEMDDDRLSELIAFLTESAQKAVASAEYKTASRIIRILRSMK